MGWDAFGLPAENAAIDRGIDTRTWTESNIAEMRDELNALGFSFDWDREVTTCRPEYYSHTQRVFKMMLDRGLAYKKDA